MLVVTGQVRLLLRSCYRQLVLFVQSGGLCGHGRGIIREDGDDPTLAYLLAQ